MMTCTCDASCDESCPVHEEENEAQDKRLIISELEEVRRQIAQQPLAADLYDREEHLMQLLGEM